MTDTGGEVSQGGKFFGRLTDQNKLPTELQGKREFTRNEVVGAFNGSFTSLERSAKNILEQKVSSGDIRFSNILQKWETRQDLTDDEKNALKSLTNVEKKRLSDYRIVKNGKSATDFAAGRDKLTLDGTKPDGSVEHFEEGVAVDGLLDYLRDEIHDVRVRMRAGTVSQTEGERLIKDMIREGYTLYHNSEDSPEKVERGHPALDGSRPFVRAQLEAYYIAHDPLRDTGDGVGNFYSGVNAMRRRRNLTFSAVAGATTTTPTITPTPTPGPAPTPGSPAPAPTPAAPTRIEDVNLEIGIVNRSVDMQSKARELSERELRQEMRRGSAWNPLNWPRKIGLRVFEEYYRQLYVKRALEAMHQHNNSYLEMGIVGKAVTISENIASKDLEKKAGKDKVEAVKEALRERIQGVGQKAVEAQGPVRDLIMSSLIRPLYNDLSSGRTVSDADMQTRLKTFVDANINSADPTVRSALQEYFGRDSNKYKVVADYFASDILDMTKQMVELHNAHGFAQDQIEQRTKIILGNASWGSETEANFNNIDKFIAKMQSNRLTAPIASPLAWGAAASLGSFFLFRLPAVGIQKLGQAAPFVAPGAGAFAGGTVAALRRHMDIRRDIATHRIERAYGGQIETKEQIDARIGNDKMARLKERLLGAYRRADLEEFAYSTITARNLVEGGGQDEIRGRARRGVADLIVDVDNAESRADLISRVAEMRMRLDYSARNKVDMVTFEGREQVEQGRLEIIKQIALAKRALLAKGVTEAQIATQENAWANSFKTDISEKEKKFNGYKNKQMAGAFAMGATTGLVGGFLGREAIVGLEKTANLVVNTFGAPVGFNTGWQIADTPVIGALKGATNLAFKTTTGHEVFTTTPDVSEFQNAFTHGGKIGIGNDHHVQVDPASNAATHTTATIVDHSGKPVGSEIFQMDSSGHMSSVGQGIGTLTQQELQHAGFKVDVHDVVTATTNHQTETFTINGQQMTMDVPKGVLPNGHDWHGVWQQHAGSKAYDMIVYDDTAKQVATLSDGQTPIKLVEQAELDATGKILKSAKNLISTEASRQVPSPSALWFKDLTTTGKAEFGVYKFSMNLSDPNDPLMVIKDASGKDVHGALFHYNPETGKFWYEALPTSAIPRPLIIALQDAGLLTKDQAAIDKMVGRIDSNELNQIYTHHSSHDFAGAGAARGGSGEQLPTGVLHTYHSGEGYVEYKTPVNLFPMTEEIDGKRVFSLAHFFNANDDARVIDASHIQIFKGGQPGEVIQVDPNALNKLSGVTRVMYNHNAHTVTAMPEDFLNSLSEVKRSLSQGRWYQNIGPEMHNYRVFIKLDPNDTRQIELKFNESGYLDIPNDPDIAKYLTFDKNGIPENAWINFGYMKGPADYNNVISFANIGMHEKIVGTLMTPGGVENVPVYGLPEPISEVALDPAHVFENPLIVTPFVPRHPLGPIDILRRGYPSLEQFGPRATLGNLIRGRRPTRTAPVTNPRGGYIINFKDFQLGEIVDGEAALVHVNDTFVKSPHVYVTLSSAIGDVVHTTAYIKGLRQYADVLGPGKKITLIAPPTVVGLLTPLSVKYNLEIISENRHDCVNKARKLMKDNNESGAMVFDFDFTEDNGPYPIIEDTDDNNLIIHELLSTAIGLYPNSRSGDNRYSDYLGDLLHIPVNRRIKVSPELPSISNADSKFEDIKRRFNIDTNKKQIAVVIEGSGDYKRYDLNKWLTVLKQLEHNDREINVIFNNSAGNYTEVELHRLFDQIKNVKIISLNLTEAEILLQKQNLVLTNDTGLAHIAAVVENGPKVISLHAYNNTPDIWVSNPSRQFGIWSGGDNLPVNEIKPEKVIEKAKEFLA